MNNYVKESKMKQRHSQLILALAVMLMLSLASQIKAVELNGLVVIKGSKTPVVGAILELDPTGKTTVSDKHGQFAFNGLAEGNYELMVAHPGFITVTKRIVIRNGNNEKLVIEMQSPGDDNYKRKEKSSESPTDQMGEIRIDSPGQPNVDQDSKARNHAPALLSEQGYAGSVVDSYSGLDIVQPKIIRQREMGYVGDYQSMPKRYLPEPQAMFFKDYGSNRFVNPRNDPLSTFALDVDDGSFNIIKEYLNRGVMPPTAAVRVEEFINHFDYGYADPERKQFRLFTEMVASPTDPNLTMLKIGIKGQELPESDRPSLNLTFVIDVSGSMRAGNRLELVKQSLKMLIEKLDQDDRVGIIAYGSTARVVLQPTSAGHLYEIRMAIGSLHAGGSTYAEAGLKLGYQMANRQFDRHKLNRVILCSDGVANVGQVSPEAIMADISEFARKGITLSTFGYGMGNYNDVLLEQLATQGDGRYAYVNDRAEAERLFVSQFVSNMAILARDAKVQVSFDPRYVQAYRLIGYENRAVADNRFRDNTQDGGEIGPGHEVTAVYELRLSNQSHRKFKRRQTRNHPIGEVTLRWTSADGHEVAEISRAIKGRARTSQFSSARPELRLAVVASEFAGVLKRSPYYQNVSYSVLLDQARSIDNEIRSEQTRELVSLIEQAARLDHHRPIRDDYFSERF